MPASPLAALSDDDLKRRAELARAALRALKEKDRQENRGLWRYAEAPIDFCTTVCNAYLYSAQKVILDAVAHNDRLAVRSCHDSGKSFTAAHLVAWWLCTNPVGEAFAITTAPTFSQVRTILWKEIGRVAVASSLPGVINQTEWKMGNEIVAIGRKPADYNTAAFQGHHASRVLVIVDEAAAVSQLMLDVLETAITTEGSKILAIGNPDDPTSGFANMFKPGSSWAKLHISAWNTPNFTGESVPEIVRRNLLSPAWVDDKRQTWGVGSPRWQSKIEGEFPDTTTDTIISLAKVERARYLDLESELDEAQLKPIEIGVDVARYGDDETVIVVRRGPVVRVYGVYGYQSTMVTVGHCVRAFRESGASVIKVDEPGVGGGVVDRLEEMGYPVIGMNGGHSPNNTEDFLNARAEWYDGLRERIEVDQVDLPLDEETAAQLSNIRKEYTSSGKLKLESKDSIKSRGLPSPDRADAIALAFAKPPAVKGKKKGKFKKATKI